MQGRARGRKGERKTYHMWQNPHKGETQGVLSYQNYQGTFATPHMKKCWYSLDNFQSVIPEIYIQVDERCL